MRVERRYFVNAGIAVVVSVAIYLFGRVGLVWLDRPRVPDGIDLRGLVVGGLQALLAMGLVLIYRTNRIINFAQAALGAMAATLAQALVRERGWNFWISVALGLTVAVLVSAFVEFAIIRRFYRAPRLILTVATIGVAQILTAAELGLPLLVKRPGKNTDITQQIKTFTSPFAWHFQFGGVIFRGDDALVLIAVPAIAIGLVAFFRLTGYGLAARAVAENSDRARLLGVRVKRVGLLVWCLAGLLAAVAAILTAAVNQLPLGAVQSPSLLLRALAAGVIGRMESLPVTFAAAIGLSVVEQQVLFAYNRSGIVDALLLLAVIVALLFQRRRGRVDETTSSWQAVQEVRPIPRELRSVFEVRLLRFAALAVTAAVVVILPQVLKPSRTGLVSVIYIYAMIAISLVILTGWAGHLSLGQWAFVGVGAYIAGRLTTAAHPQDFFVSLLIAGAVGAVLAVAIGLPALRIRGLFLGVTTLAFAVAAQSWVFQLHFLTIDSLVARPLIFGRFDVDSEKGFYWVTVAGLLLAILAARNLRRSRLGRTLIAARDNEKAVQSMAVNLTRNKLVAFAVSGFFASVAGGLYGFQQQFVKPDRFPPEASLLIFSMVVIGGMGSLSGAILGAIAIQGTRYFLPNWAQFFVTGIGLLFLLLVFPGGLGQILYMLRDGYLRWVAKRRRILVPSLVADKKTEEAEAMPTPVLQASGGSA